MGRSRPNTIKYALKNKKLPLKRPTIYKNPYPHLHVFFNTLLSEVLHLVQQAEDTMEVFREFLESSTIHGLTYISTAKVSTFIN